MSTYSHRGFKVSANSVKEGIDKLVDKIVEYELARNYIFKKADELVHGWCICDYYVRFGDPSNNMGKESNKLIHLMQKFSGMKFEHFDSKKMRKRLLNDVLCDCYEFDRRLSAVADTFMYMHEDFSIHYEESYYFECAKDFVKELPELIRVMSEEKVSKMYDYVLGKFKIKE